MRFFEIHEARRNKDHPSQQIDRSHGPKDDKAGIMGEYGKQNIADFLEPYYDDPSIYISFSDVLKIGINPNSSFLTPLGIYTYPLIAYQEKLKDERGEHVFPFASDRQHMFVLRANAVPKDVSDYTSADYERDYAKLTEMYGDYPVDIAAAFAKTGSPIDKFWSICYYITKTNETKSIEGELATSSLEWNKILRKLGYVGFSDLQGIGRIHEKEPIQAFFLSKKYLEVVDVYSTYRFKNRLEQKKDYNTLQAIVDRVDRNPDYINYLPFDITFTLASGNTALFNRITDPKIKMKIENKIIKDEIIWAIQRFIEHANISDKFGADAIKVLVKHRQKVTDLPHKFIANAGPLVQQALVTIEPSYLGLFKNPSIEAARIAIPQDKSLVPDMQKFNRPFPKEFQQIHDKFFENS